MKQIMLIIYFLATTLNPVVGKVILVEGKYQNKNIYVNNGFNNSGVGFCTYEVLVNGQVATDEINSSSYEIDLAQFQLKYGDKVTIEIRHGNDCNPKILNPEVLKSKPTFDTESISVAADGNLEWTTVNESGPLPFVIEQFKWNKWIQVGEVQGDGSPGVHHYGYHVVLHAGENKFRVKQIGYGLIPRYSKQVVSIGDASQLSYSTSKISNEILFTGPTLFEVYDAYGQVVKKGYGKVLSLSSLKRGHYFLCYDNSIAEFKKR